MKSLESSLIVFVRFPQPGCVKTRLGAAIGDKNACALYRAFVSDLTETLQVSGVPFVFAYDPPGRKEAVMKWLGSEHSYLPQRGRDVGERMENAFLNIFSTGVNAAVLIGSDIPNLSPARIGEAFRMLADWDAVIGPARDGGYYLIGFRRETFCSEGFRSVRWGTETVFRDTLSILRSRGTRVGVVGPESDIDTLEGLRDLLRGFEGCGFRARRTRALLESREDLLRAIMGSPQQ